MATQLEQSQPALDKLAKSHVCSQCQPSRFYGSLDALRRHRKTHHNEIKPSWQCPNCNQKPFPRKDHLTRHVKEKHTGEYLGECDLCLRTFANRYLKEHMEACKSRCFGQATESPLTFVDKLQWEQPKFGPPLLQAAGENVAKVSEQAPRLKFVRGFVAPIFRRKKIVSSNKHEVVMASSSSTRKQRLIGNTLESLELNEQQQVEIWYAVRLDDIARLTQIIASYVDSQHTLLSMNESYSFLGGTLLHSAAGEGSIQVVRMLLSAGVNVNSPDERLRTPVNDAAHFSKVAIVRLLVRQGADVDAKDSDGRTALFRACLDPFGSDKALQIVNLLLEHGASIDVEDRWNATALCVAASHGNHLIAERLLEAGASVNGSSKEGSPTPLMGACFSGEPVVVHMLLEYGADINRCHSQPRPPHGLDPYERDFFDREADVSPGQHKSRWTALAYVCGPRSSIEEMEKMSSRLLAAGADPNLGDVVPLETAIIYGYPSVIKILLDAGADPQRLTDECVETLQGLRLRHEGCCTYEERKEKWALLQQYHPSTFGDKVFHDRAFG